jgi:hypothetical protein
MGLEPTILPLGGARLIHLATQAAHSMDCASEDQEVPNCKCHPHARIALVA